MTIQIGNHAQPGNPSGGTGSSTSPASSSAAAQPDQAAGAETIKIGNDSFEVLDGVVSRAGQKIGTLDANGGFTGLDGQLVNDLHDWRMHAEIVGPSGTLTVGNDVFKVHDGRIYNATGMQVGSINDAGDWNLVINAQHLKGSLQDLVAAGAIFDGHMSEPQG